MLYREICKILGFFLFGLTLALSVPFCLAVYYEFIADPALHPQPHTTLAFFATILISLTLSGWLYYLGRRVSGHLYRREGLAAVVLIWFITPAIAGLPYFLSSTLDNPLQAYFEAVSGFSTTGATTMQAKAYNQVTGEEIPIQKAFCGAHTTIYTYYGTIDPVRDPQTGAVLYEGIEAVSLALLFWRGLTQWLGGMGIIVLFVAVLPALGVGGKTLFQAEVPGPMKDSLTPRIKETAIQLWKIYLGFTVLEVGLLMATNGEMSLYDAVTVTLSTISTGGFSTKNNSIGAFQNPITEWIVLVFMLIGSINFSLYFFALRGKFYRIYQPEFILYVVVVTLSCLLGAWFLIGTARETLTGDPAGVFSQHEAIRYGFFQVVSTLTSTGFVTANYNDWPNAVQALMLILMFLGGMSGSTAGGMKMIRHYMLFRVAQYKVESLFRPETVRNFRIGEKEVDSSSSIMVLVYFLIVAAIAVLGTFIFIIDGIDPQTSLSITALMVNNIGIGFQMASASESFAFLSNFSLVFSIILMVLGRLEFFAALALLVPAFWRQNS